MLRTQCAQCAAPLAHNAPRCGICKTRYCGRDCQKLHWKDGHKELCPVIKRRGGPEVIYAGEKYKEAVAEAVEACADDTEGQTCFICMDGQTEEGLLRMCACRGAAGFAHLSCLARQAQAAVERVAQKGWKRWDTCGLCEQRYHGVVACALGWACWKTYLGRPETDWARGSAMTALGNGLSAADRHEDALSVREAEVALLRRLGTSEGYILQMQGNLADTYLRLNRLDEALQMKRDVYSGRLRLNGEEHEDTLLAANNLAVCLRRLRRFEEAKALMRRTIPVARRVLGEGHQIALNMRLSYVAALCSAHDDRSTIGMPVTAAMATRVPLDDLREAVTTLEETERTARRVLGPAHPLTKGIDGPLRVARAALHTRETPSAS